MQAVVYQEVLCLSRSAQKLFAPARAKISQAAFQPKIRRFAQRDLTLQRVLMRVQEKVDDVPSRSLFAFKQPLYLPFALRRWRQ